MFYNRMQRFKHENEWDEEDYVLGIVKMAHYANEKFIYYQSVWIEFDENAFVFAIAIGAWNLIFTFAVYYSGVIKGGEQVAISEAIGALIVVLSYVA
jgi:hypothetical protein